MKVMRESVQRFDADERHQICLLVVGLAIVLTVYGAVPDAVKTGYAVFIDDARAWGATAPAGLAAVGNLLGRWVGGTAIGAPFLAFYWLLYQALGAIRRPSM